MGDDAETRLKRIEAKLNGLSAVVAVVSIIGLGALLYRFFQAQWGWSWVLTLLAAWAIACAIVILALIRGYRITKT